MIGNSYRSLLGLLPDNSIRVMTVQAVAAGVSTVTTAEGATLQVIGDSVAVGSQAFVQGGRILGAAPTLPVSEVYVQV